MASSASSSVPVLVDVDLQRQVGDGADRADPLDVEPVAPAELQLQPAEARVDAARRGAPCRRGRRARPSTTSAGPPRCEPEQLPDRLADELPAEIVERRVERRPSPRGSPGSSARRRPDGLERERIVAEELRRPRRGTPRRPRRSRRSGAAAAPRRSPRRRRARARPRGRASSTVVSREIVNGSASWSVARRWVSFTPGTLSPSAPVAQGIERAPPEREVVGSIPTRRIAARLRPVAGSPRGAVKGQLRARRLGQLPREFLGAGRGSASIPAGTSPMGQAGRRCHRRVEPRRRRGRGDDLQQAGHRSRAPPRPGSRSSVARSRTPSLARGPLVHHRRAASDGHLDAATTRPPSCRRKRDATCSPRSAGAAPPDPQGQRKDRTPGASGRGRGLRLAERWRAGLL